MTKKYLNQSRIMQKYNITRRLMKLFFSAPDFTNPNPFGEGLPPELMFSMERVKRIIQTDEFQRELEISKKHSKKHRNRDHSTYPGRKGYPKKEEDNCIAAS